MPLSWTSVAQKNKILLAHLSEVKTNSDTTLTAISSSFSWSEWNPAPSQKDRLKSAEIDELRDAVDYCDDQNYCRSENISQTVLVDTGEHATDDLTEKHTADGTANATYNGTKNNTIS